MSRSTRTPSARRRPWWLIIAVLIVGYAAWALVIEPRVAQIGFVSPGECVTRVGTNERLKTSECESPDLTYHVVGVHVGLRENAECPSPEILWHQSDHPGSADTNPDAPANYACLAPNFREGHCYRAASDSSDTSDAVIRNLTALYGEFPCDSQGAGFFRVITAHQSADQACSPDEIALSYPTPGRTYCVVPQPAP